MVSIYTYHSKIITMPRKKNSSLVKKTYWIQRSAAKCIAERCKNWNWSASMVMRDILATAFSLYKNKPKPQKRQELELS